MRLLVGLEGFQLGISAEAAQLWRLREGLVGSSGGRARGWRVSGTCWAPGDTTTD